MITGIGMPFSIFCVCAFNALQNSMMLRPRWPSAGPIGGDGLAAPAGTCNLRNPVTFFAISHSVSGADLGGWQPPHLPRHFTFLSALVTGISLRTARLCQFIGITGTTPAMTASLKLLHLSEFQFDRSSAPED